MQTSLLHRPDSMSLRYGGDLRVALLAQRMFVLQVAHPAVGAGVWQHSAFREDPWKRLREIRESGRRFMYSGPDAARAEGVRLRELHRDIKGTDSHGRRYHALNPETYGWVHAVFLDTTITAHALFGTPLTRAEQRLLFCEWREGGHFFGLREQDLPRTLEEYEAFWDHAMRHTVEWSDILAYLLDPDMPVPPAPPALSLLPAPLWRGLWKPLQQRMHLLTLGSLPPVLRERFPEHLPWGDGDAARFAAWQRRVRRAFEWLPVPLRYPGDARHAMKARLPATTVAQETDG
ncbi:MAG: oxygenase MpaB family protein [Pseudomonadota bacterium]